MQETTVTLAVAGAGVRGSAYADRCATGGAATIVAVAERDPVRRAAFAERHGIPLERTFADWRDLAAAGRLADGIIVATLDHEHVEPAVRFAGQGYHILLEKPMATTEPDCQRIIDAVERSGSMLAVCHVLRYTPYTRLVRQLIAKGRIGTPVSVQHLEPVGWWHQAHSYVRGNWRREAESGPMLLTKSCHDIDWIMHVLGEVPSRVSSFGRLSHFRPDNRPAGAADRCLDCPVERDCAYSAKRLYLSCLGDPDRERWPLGAVTHDVTTEGVLAALRDGPYGRCVYGGDNDVVDHQVVSMEFPSGATASFTMTAFTPMAQRQTRIFGTRGYLEGDSRQVSVRDFVTGEVETFDTGTGHESQIGHVEADDALADAFVAALATGDRSLLSSDARESLAGHRVVWAAELARRTGQVVEIPR
ncbi:Oxidoreductase family, C-terminal alpha/beta domain [Micromonospora citrea]|uniref:Oxidoreductase family, C-terminal alpha/beta domain n=1 Tax=Micromonospora citrea TaxID=47855 RepID=A0A1C6W348_9ACTN|nr:Gfo/Idh/MocA family oxidoreductase [Micromonospora citrea]SCL72834.1 Oxidoreductase family, C-terminal alpha/beta domain [Micromonospora citrea]